MYLENLKRWLVNTMVLTKTYHVACHYC